MPAGCGELPEESPRAERIRACGVGQPGRHASEGLGLGRCSQEAGGDGGEVLAHPGLDRPQLD